MKFLSLLTKKHVLPIIVISQFFCTSLWFAGNGVINDLVNDFNLPNAALGHLTSAVQFGFIMGTLSFAIMTIADRYSPSKVFLISAILGSLFNIAIIWKGNSYFSLITLRCFTGFFLAGIYPVGMKIAADYFDKGLGKSLGFLVGALVLGTALPHLLKNTMENFSWKSVLILTSSLALIGGLLMVFFVPDGPFRKPSKKIDFSAFFKVFQKNEFRSAAFGYFGHMWELYAFWTFVPIMLATYKSEKEVSLNIPFWSFLIIGVGGLACVLGGYISQKIGVKKTAFYALLISGVCCLLIPWMFHLNSPFIFLSFLLIWGMVVIADSPLFSTLVAQNAETKIKGTALTIVNCIGFAITIVSIQLLTKLSLEVHSNWIYSMLAIGPILGLLGLKRKNSNSTS